MNTDIEPGSNTQLEKKFDEYNTLESDRVDIRNIFGLADFDRKRDIIENIDFILQKFNKIHIDVINKQTEIINKGVEDILANLSVFRNDKKVLDVLATLD